VRVEARLVRVGARTLVSLALCAAAAGAAMAHYVIDVIGDFLLPRDSYDHLAHGSRELVTGVALLAAAVLAARGLRVCCEIATVNRGRLMRPALRLRESAGLLLGAVVASAVMVPAMECLDGRLDGVPVARLADAFGGSVGLGLATTLLCAGVVALLVCGVARWLISHRDSIATIIETLLRRVTGSPASNGYELAARRFTPSRRQTSHALRLSKRGPPAISFA
jgi:hypothetical protein